MKLTQGIYGDLSCNLFGLQLDQKRQNEVIRNAGWFNIKGEKIGKGDLSLDDIDNIACGLQSEDLFIILNEADSSWDMPGNLDRFAPGLPYVMEKARWIASGLDRSVAMAFKVHDNCALNPSKKIEGDIEYTYCDRYWLHKTLDFNGQTFLNVKPSTVISSIIPKNYYGLDLYNLSDGTQWALGTHNESLNAAHLIAPEWYHHQSVQTFKHYCALTDKELEIIDSMIVNFGRESNSILIKLVDNSWGMNEKVIENYGVPTLIAKYDGLQKNSSSISGLPTGKYAYRIK